VSDIAKQDEMLELLFWMEGEGLSASANLAGIARFLVQPENEAELTLQRLLARGDVVLKEDRRFALTEPGRREAGRRFVEDFSSLIAQGHGECNDPQCDCRTSPGGAADCAVHRA
jgi:hypothetical protein